MVKRGRPLGKKNKKRRGRPIGSKNKVITITPIKRVGLRCKKCKRHFLIRTDNLELYTPEIKKSWVCPICKQYRIIK